MKTILQGIEFADTIDQHKNACLYTNGTYDEMLAARNALLSTGHQATEPTFMYAGQWCVYGYKPLPVVSQEALERLDAYRYEAQHPAWTKSSGAKRKAKMLRKVLK